MMLAPPRSLPPLALLLPLAGCEPDPGPVVQGDACDAVVAPGESLQQAIDDAGDGSVLCLEPGTWTEAIRIHQRSVSLVGSAGASQTVIDATGLASSVVVIEGIDDVSLTGLTITGGEAEDRGGGLLLDGGSASLDDVVFTGNQAYEGGGLAVDAGELWLSRCRITDNTTGWDGAGMLVESGAVVWAEQLWIEGNTSGFDAGGILVRGALTLSNAVFTDNEAPDDAGAMRVTRGTAALSNVLLAGNRAGAHGGAIYAYDQGHLWLTNVALLGNQARGGGAVYLKNQASMFADNVVVQGNSVEEEGGGFFVAFSELALASAVLRDNHATLAGGGLYLDTAVAVIDHSSVGVNQPDDCDSSALSTCPTMGADLDPGFLDASGDEPLAWDLHLSASSEAVDAGDPVLPDPDGGPGDIGIYGGPWADAWDLDADGWPEWWQPGPYAPEHAEQGLDCDDDDASLTPEQGC
jgi:predicted outer membrane repeat protein